MLIVECRSYIFQELITAGDLFSYLEFNGGQLSDISTAVIIRQILKAIEYLHGMNIVHRDLKPQNILMTSLSEGARVVVTDFGHARYLQAVRTKCAGQKQSRMVSVVGTYEWSAPYVSGCLPLIEKTALLINYCQRDIRNKPRVKGGRLLKSGRHVVDRYNHRCDAYWIFFLLPPPRSGRRPQPWTSHG